MVITNRPTITANTMHAIRHAAIQRSPGRHVSPLYAEAVGLASNVRYYVIIDTDQRKVTVDRPSTYIRINWKKKKSSSSGCAKRQPAMAPTLTFGQGAHDRASSGTIRVGSIICLLYVDKITPPYRRCPSIDKRHLVSFTRRRRTYVTQPIWQGMSSSRSARPGHPIAAGRPRPSPLTDDTIYQQDPAAVAEPAANRT